MRSEEKKTDASGWYRWHELKRQEVRELAAEALVVVPLGATEQHGPFMPTGTDIMMSTHAVEGALDLAAPGSARPLILAQILNIGCSAHHLPFGGTISLPPQVMIEVLVEAALSMMASGVRRIVFVNGHGGNTGVCHSAASEAASRSELSVAALDYWEMTSRDDPTLPGHAGAFETSLMLAHRPDLVASDRERENRDDVAQPGRGVYGRGVWRGIDGFTDHPNLANAEQGAADLADIHRNLADRLIELGQGMP